VFITGIPMKPEKDKDGTKCTVYAFNLDGMTVAHLGSLSFVPTQHQIDALETIDVLLVPISGDGELTPSQASEVISMIEPSIVIPMSHGKGHENLDKFLKEMGLAGAKTQDSLKVSKRDLPEDTQVVLLEARS
jgi:L-ascorbate metabolism protein UlaG (beta-lactamase superfamily)